MTMFVAMLLYGVPYSALKRDTLSWRRTFVRTHAQRQRNPISMITSYSELRAGAAQAEPRNSDQDPIRLSAERRTPSLPAGLVGTDATVPSCALYAKLIYIKKAD